MINTPIRTTPHSAESHYIHDQAPTYREAKIVTCRTCGRTGKLGFDLYWDARYCGGVGYVHGYYCLGGCK